MDIQRLKLVGWILSLLICLVMLGGLGLLKLSRPDQEISAGWIASLLIFATGAVAATTEILRAVRYGVDVIDTEPEYRPKRPVVNNLFGALSIGFAGLGYLIAAAVGIVWAGDDLHVSDRPFSILAHALLITGLGTGILGLHALRRKEARRPVAVLGSLLSIPLIGLGLAAVVTYIVNA